MAIINLEQRSEPPVSEIAAGTIDIYLNSANGLLEAKDSSGNKQVLGIAGVLSVNGETGTVTLDTDDIDDSASTNKYVTQALIDKLNNIEAGAEVNTVTSVNGQIGAVSLSLDDLDDVIAAAPSGALAGKKFFLEVNGAGTDYILTERFRASAVLAEGSGLVTQTEINGGGTNYEPALLLNATIPTTGTYRVSLRFKWSLDNTSINFLSRVAWTDNTSTVTNIFEHAQESQDSGGTGETLNNISGGTISGTLGTGTDQKTAGGDETELTLAAGSHSFQFEFGLQALDGTAEAAVYSAYLVVESV